MKQDFGFALSEICNASVQIPKHFCLSLKIPYGRSGFITINSKVYFTLFSLYLLQTFTFSTKLKKNIVTVQPFGLSVTESAHSKPPAARGRFPLLVLAKASYRIFRKTERELFSAITLPIRIHFQERIRYVRHSQIISPKTRSVRNRRFHGTK